MTHRRGHPPRNDGTNEPNSPPVGATMDLYEAVMMQMIASRVIDAYKERDQSRQIDLERQPSKPSSSEDDTSDDEPPVQT